MAPHSSTLAWKMLWTEEPGRLQSIGSLRVGHNWATSLSLFLHALEKEMATHSSVLAWRIPGTGEPDGLPSMGSQSRTRLKRLSSSSSRCAQCNCEVESSPNYPGVPNVVRRLLNCGRGRWKSRVRAMAWEKAIVSLCCLWMWTKRAMSQRTQANSRKVQSLDSDPSQSLRKNVTFQKPWF